MALKTFILECLSPCPESESIIVVVVVEVVVIWWVPSIWGGYACFCPQNLFETCFLNYFWNPFVPSGPNKIHKE